MTTIRWIVFVACLSLMSLLWLPLTPVAVTAPLAATPQPPYRSIVFTGTVTHGAMYDQSIAPNLNFQLIPDALGWSIWLGNPVHSDENYARVMAPLPAQRAQLFINVDTPRRHGYDFDFVMNATDYQTAAANQDRLREADLIRRQGTVMLTRYSEGIMQFSVSLNSLPLDLPLHLTSTQIITAPLVATPTPQPPSNLITFSDTITRGMLYDQPIAPGLHFQLIPYVNSCTVWMGDPTQPDHSYITAVTPPHQTVDLTIHINTFNHDNRDFRFVMNAADYQAAMDERQQGVPIADLTAQQGTILVQNNRFDLMPFSVSLNVPIDLPLLFTPTRMITIPAVAMTPAQTVPVVTARQISTAEIRTLQAGETPLQIIYGEEPDPDGYARHPALYNWFSLQLPAGTPTAIDYPHKDVLTGKLKHNLMTNPAYTFTRQYWFDGVAVSPSGNSLMLLENLPPPPFNEYAQPPPPEFKIWWSNHDASRIKFMHQRFPVVSYVRDITWFANETKILLSTGIVYGPPGVDNDYIDLTKRIITESPGFWRAPSLSPDEQQIAVIPLHSRNNEFGIANVAHIDDDSAYKLYQFEESLAALSWAKNGEVLYILSGSAKLYHFNLTTETFRPIVQASNYEDIKPYIGYNTPHWLIYPDEKIMVIASLRTGLWVVEW